MVTSLVPLHVDCGEHWLSSSCVHGRNASKTQFTPANPDGQLHAYELTMSWHSAPRKHGAEAHSLMLSSQSVPE